MSDLTPERIAEMLENPRWHHAGEWYEVRKWLRRLKRKQLPGIMKDIECYIFTPEGEEGYEG